MATTRSGGVRACGRSSPRAHPRVKSVSWGCSQVPGREPAEPPSARGCAARRRGRLPAPGRGSRAIRRARARSRSAQSRPESRIAIPRAASTSANSRRDLDSVLLAHPLHQHGDLVRAQLVVRLPVGVPAEMMVREASGHALTLPPDSGSVALSMRHHEHERRPADQLQERAPEPPKPVHNVLALQRTAGNQAVAAMLARQPVAEETTGGADKQQALGKVTLTKIGVIPISSFSAGMASGRPHESTDFSSPPPSVPQHEVDAGSFERDSPERRSRRPGVQDEDPLGPRDPLLVGHVPGRYDRVVDAHAAARALDDGSGGGEEEEEAAGAGTAVAASPASQPTSLADPPRRHAGSRRGWAPRRRGSQGPPAPPRTPAMYRAERARRPTA